MTTFEEAFDQELSNRQCEVAWNADRAARAGNHELAVKLYEEAATLEERLANGIPDDWKKLRSEIAVSAAWLWFKAGKYDEAIRWIDQFSNTKVLANFAPTLFDEVRKACREAAEK